MKKDTKKLIIADWNTCFVSKKYLTKKYGISLYELNNILNGKEMKVKTKARIHQLEKENADMVSIKVSLKAISEKANKSFLKKLFD